MMEIVLILLYAAVMILPRLIIIPLAVHAVVIVLSALDYGRIPLVGLHDTFGFLAFSLGAVYSVLGWNRGRGLFTYLMIPLILLLLAGSAFSHPAVGPLPPLLRTIWFELHVMLSFVSYAMFGAGATFGVVYLARGDADAEAAQYRLLFFGYMLFSIAMIFGGIWAQLAWGTYWLWTPKELWTTIVWFWYGLYLHARLVKGWSGQISSAMGVAGFVIVMFLYAGVGLLMKSSHEF